MAIPYIFVDFVMGWFARLLDILGGRLIEPFNPDVIT
jgi:hypothetical protein